MAMRRLFSLSLALMLPFQAALAGNFIQFPTFKDEPLEASTFWPAATTLLPFIATTVLSQGMSRKLSDSIAAAKDDAASYVASNGEIRGPFLESSLRELRQDPHWAKRSEAELVQAILVWPAG
ncbi:DUF2388 domain-containing protein [Pseudomonas nitroreducens]|uniref:DUF2388 domain-containing protein n=1 Tax=Pseudomonas nitroreducens TaxID=46680 RepID=UPI00209D72D5|nr:DUF2388 domain-containing protein [Pseudomonas nitroreducens]MCP1621455.1 uncharacterized protein (TIGR02448 family) [Pseudomonas nitroreducens]